MSIFDTLKKLQNEQSKKIEPSYIYLEDNQVKEKKISELLDSAGSTLINKVMKKKQNPARLIRDSKFPK